MNKKNSKKNGMILTILALFSTTSAHMSMWSRSMYGVRQTTDGTGYGWVYDAGDPVAPIGPGVQNQNDWWFRGPTWRALKPLPGAVTLLPVGESINVEIACHVAWTSIGWRTTVAGSHLDACPDNPGAYHIGDPNSYDLDASDLSGCALGIADVDDIEKVTWDNMVIFSVQSKCVYQRNTPFEIPASMPACTGEKCICGWFWLANKGIANFYMTAFDCKVTGSKANAPAIAPPQDAIWCPSGNTTCVQTKGAKRPLYAYNNPSNVQTPGNVDRPGYHQSWGFYNGAQNDIFVGESSIPKTTTTKLSIDATTSSTTTSSSAVAAITTTPVIAKIAEVTITTTTTTTVDDVKTTTIDTSNTQDRFKSTENNVVLNAAAETADTTKTGQSTPEPLSKFWFGRPNAKYEGWWSENREKVAEGYQQRLAARSTFSKHSRFIKAKVLRH